VRLSSNSLEIIVIAMLCAVCFGSEAEAQQRPYYFGRTTDPTPVEVALQDKEQLIRFRIPKVYMTFSDNWKGGVQDFIVLETIFPSMAPLSATRSSERGPDVVIIDLQSHGSTEGDSNVSRELEWRIATQWSLVDRIAEQSGETFRVYVHNEDVKNRAMRNVMMKEFLVPDSGADPPNIYFDCLIEGENPSVGCFAHSNFGQNLSLEFIFRRTELQHWREIRDAVVNLLNGFRQKPER
jgi:hypothetical protein